jgi:DNA-binding HxlR family transcriptional regulator
MVRHPVVTGRPCAVAATLELVGDRWSLLAVREVQLGNHRFSQIVRNTGAPRDRLAARLKSLVDAGILERREYQSRRFDYHLTQAGRELGSVLSSLRTWGEQWAVDEPPMLVEHRGHRFQARVVCEICGDSVGEDGLHWTSAARGWSVSGPDGGGRLTSLSPSAPSDRSGAARCSSGESLNT